MNKDVIRVKPLAPEQTECLKNYDRIFDTVINHLGDEDLLSSCNSEYFVGDKDIIVTDGMVCYYGEKDWVQKGRQEEECIIYRAAVRGATYVITIEYVDPEQMDYSLYIEDDFIVSKYDEVVNRLQNAIDHLAEMKRFQNEKRGTIIPKECVIDEIKYIED